MNKQGRWFRSRRVLFACALACATACGGAAPAARPKAPAAQPAAAPVTPEPDPEPPPPPAAATLKIKGLTGTLNTDDVHQTMEARQAVFDACIKQHRRRLRWVSGAIRFAFKVDAEGKVEQAHVLDSSIGHQALEACISSAVVETVFPKPSGRARAEFEWGLTVDPVPGRLPEPVEADRLDRVLRKHTPEIYKKCEARRSRERFRVTAYIARDGHVLSIGAVAKPPRAAEKMPCVLGELANLRMPKLERNGKVSFELR